VALGLAVVEALAGEKLPFEIEVAGFSEEEGVRFGFPFIGSRAFVGRLDKSTLNREDAAGISVASAIDGFGLDRSRLGEAVFNPRSFAYLEFHIEQGPVLESMGQPLAVVDSISGQSRATITFEGKANHAGTTPMCFRRDALAAAAEWISSVETRADATNGLVATVGKLDVPAGAGNIVPGLAVASLDVRHSADGTRRTAFDKLIEVGAQIAARRGVNFSHVVQLDQGTVPMDSRLVELAERSLQECGIRSRRMASGAGHDAMVVAQFIPSVMVFLRSPGGLSHHPDESVLLDDVELALRSGLQFLKALGSTLPYK
jgi:allantoate deiminase